MQVTLVVEIPNKDLPMITQSAIERVINTSIELAIYSDAEDSYINEEDWKRSKNTVVNLWTRLQDAIYRAQNNLPSQAAAQFVYVVAQQTPHGASVTGDRCYTDVKLAEAECDYYKREKMDWMKRFTLYVKHELPEYMQPK